MHINSSANSNLGLSDELDTIKQFLSFFCAYLSSVLPESFDEGFARCRIWLNAQPFSTKGLVKPLEDDRVSITETTQLTMAWGAFASSEKVDRSITREREDEL